MSADAGMQSAAELAAAVRAGRVRAEAAADAALDAARAADTRRLNAFVARHLSARDAFAGAERVGGDAAKHRRAARGVDGGALAGVPVAVSDDLAELALPTTCGSRLLAGYVSPYEATAVARLLDAGAVVLGKTNMDEFGIGGATALSAYGPTLHPVDPARTPGGACGGSAAAVAAGLVRIALGSDTGGDVRRPAAYCGVVGIKPTYGRVSRSGLAAHASSLPQVGVFGRTVDDAALALEVISGRDPRDATTADIAVPRLRADGAPVEDGRPLKGVRVGHLRDDRGALDPELAAGFDTALGAMRDLGAEIREVRLPHLALAAPAHEALAAAESASALARYDGVRFGRRAEALGVRALYERTRAAGFGPDVARHVLLGTHLLADGGVDSLLRRAQGARARVAHDLADAFGHIDLLVAPATRGPAAPLGSPGGSQRGAPADTPTGADLPVEDAGHAGALTLAANLAGVPAMTLPIGRARGLSVSVQLLASHFGEALMIRAAAALERVRLAEAIA